MNYDKTDPHFVELKLAAHKLLGRQTTPSEAAALERELLDAKLSFKQGGVMWSDLDILYRVFKKAEPDTLYLGAVSALGSVSRMKGHLRRALDARCTTKIVAATDLARVLQGLGFEATPIDLVTGEAKAVAKLAPSKDDAYAPDMSFDDLRAPLGVIAALKAAMNTKRTLLLNGKPGVGKTLAARRCAAMMPLSEAARIEVLKNFDDLGLFRPITSAPFRAPHHSVSERGLEQEIKLAEHGVLFIDEVDEFSPACRRLLQRAANAPNIMLIMSVARWVAMTFSIESEEKQTARQKAVIATLPPHMEIDLGEVDFRKWRTA